MISPKKIKTIGDRCLGKSQKKSNLTKMRKTLCRDVSRCGCRWYRFVAPQIGVNKRVIIVDESTEEHGKYAHLMVNPKITWKSEEKVLLDEGCLSVPDQNGEVLRSKSIKVTFQNKDGKYKKWKLDGMLPEWFSTKLTI